MQHDVEYVKKQKIETESTLRNEIQKWRGDAEAAERKCRSLNEDLRNTQNKLKQINNDYEGLQKNTAVRSNDMNQLDGEYNTIQDKFQRADQEL